jgi:hypothetical protein
MESYKWSPMLDADFGSPLGPGKVLAAAMNE